MTHDRDDEAARRHARDDDQDDTLGQALTWKVRKPIPDVEEDDARGHGLRPRSEPGASPVPPDDDPESA